MSQATIEKPLDHSGLPPAPAGKLFDLSLTDEQQMTRDTLTRFAQSRMRPLAGETNETCATPPALLGELHQFGINFLSIPESLGGSALHRAVVTNVLIAEDLAHGDMGQAVAMLAPLGVVNALVDWGSAAQRERWLPRFVEDSPFAASLAVHEGHPAFDPIALRTKAQKTATGFRLNGAKSAVPRAQDASLFVVAAELEGSGPALFLVESGTKGLKAESKPMMGLRAATTGQLSLVDVEVAADALLGEGGPFDYARFLDLCRIGWCALACGTAQAVQDYVIPYVNERVAFGEPISHRQSVAFMVANIGIELESMRLLTLRAATRAEQGLDCHREAVLARTLCAEKAMEIGNSGVQLLGGHGFIKEHPVERWYRDLRAVAIMEGGLSA